MAWTRPAGNSSTGSSTTLAVTAGDLVVVFVGSNNTGTTISDGVNTYTVHEYYTSNRPSQCHVFACIAATTTTLTITASTGTIDAVHAACFQHGGDPLVAEIDDTDEQGTTASVTLTTTQDNTLLVGFLDCSTSGSPGSGFTQLGVTVSSYRLLSEYKLADNSAGSQTVDATVGTARGIIGVAFKLVGSGGGGGGGNPWYYRAQEAIVAFRRRIFLPALGIITRAPSCGLIVPAHDPVIARSA